MNKKLFLFALVLASAVACHREAKAPAKPKPVVAKPEASAPASTEVGSMMPAYSTTLLDGKPLDLTAERGNVVFLNVWATWCGPCRGEIPLLKKMDAQYAPRGFKVIGVSIDDGGAQQVKDFVKQEQIGYPVALDADGNIANLIRTTVLPTSLLIDRNGKIVWRQIGAIDENDQALTTAIERALSANRS